VIEGPEPEREKVTVPPEEPPGEAEDDHTDNE
jgi:hypothetical protein